MTNGLMSTQHRARIILTAGLLCLAMIASTLAGAVPSAEAADVEFDVTAGDLHFILQQIQISESHAENVVTEDPDASPLCSESATFDFAVHGQMWTEPDGDYCVGNANLPHGLRTVDGRWNNLYPGQDGYGAGGEMFRRLLTPEFRDADPIPAVPDGAPAAPGGPADTPTSYTQDDGYVYDAQPRRASNLIVDQTTNNPAAVTAAELTEEYGSTVDGGPAPTQTDIWTTLPEDATELIYSSTPSAVSSSPEAMAQRTDASAVYIEGAGESVQFTATHGFRWIGNTSSGRGIAEVYVNGMLAATVNQYSADDTPGQVHVEATGLGPDEKTIEIVNTGQLTEPASQSRTEIDAIGLLDITVDNGAATVTELNETNTALTYTADTTPVGDATGRTDGTAWYIEEAGGAVEFTVTDGFEWIGNVAPARGLARIYINEVPVAEVDQHSDTMVPGQTLYAVAGLGLDEKSVRIVNVGGTSPTGHPARTEIDAIRLHAVEQEAGSGTIFVPNVATDEGLSAPFSSWSTIFGQFFDHGLDLVDKGGNGTVVVPLDADDPLMSDPRMSQSAPYLMLSRATQYEDGQGVVQHRNRTTPFIDQNQTYASHASHHVFLREYDLVGDAPVPTGRLLVGEGGGMANWADVKEQAATVLGIQLTDTDALNVPEIETDPYGRFVPGDNGFPQLVNADESVVEGSPDDPISTANAARVDQAFLDDIAHHAVPGTWDHDSDERTSASPTPRIPQTPDSDAGFVDDRDPGTYDDELLGAHYIAGDGRANENIALTAVHHVFHSEHNRLTGQIEQIITDDTQFDLADRFAAVGFWDRPERIFQAARFLNEMQYQHLAVEEFLRMVAPTMDVQPLNESAYHPELNAAITAEFAHVVYRFGHSMLTEELPRVYDDGSTETLSLLDGFLNPHEFDKGGAIDPDEAAASLIRGLSNQVGNGIDEFVTPTLRNNLLGLPLDLATINMTRARDVGVPPLQAARQQFYDATLDPTLEPYGSWEEFRLELKHRDSIVNFIAAYGKGDDVLEAADNNADRRTRAAQLVQDADYMARDAAETGLNDVDFWVGGLAERTMAFGGMLGSTFNFVFESQAELLQNADRFYYLTRTQGQNLLSQLEANSFSGLIERATTAETLPFDVFNFATDTIDLEELAATDPSLWPEGVVDVGGVIRYDGGEHIVMVGTQDDDAMHGGDGDDSIYGRDGDDDIQGGDGNDSIIGGNGDDVLDDIFGDDTFLGGPGADVIRAGPGEDLILPGSGSDFTMVTKDDLNSTFNGTGNDFVFGSTGSDRIWGGDDDDWIEGNTGGGDLLQGDNAIIWQNDPNGGHDVIISGGGNNDMDSDGGDDIMIGGPGNDRAEGMLGFDWVTYKGHTQPVVADMKFTGLMPPDLAGTRDRFDLVEGLSGWEGNDVLRGMEDIDDIFEGTDGHLMTDEQLDRIDGLRTLLRPNNSHPNYACRFMQDGACAIPQYDSDGTSNLLLGGAGSDIIEGRAGDDFIDGDVWLNVQIRWDNGDSQDDQFFDSMLEIGDRVLAREINPAELHIHRSIVTPAAEPDVVDTAVYANTRSEYTIEPLGDGYWSVFHDGAVELEESDGRDVLRNIEQVRFPDGCVNLLETGPEECETSGFVEFSHESPIEDQEIVATVTIEDADSPTNLTYEWQHGEDGEEWEPTLSSQATTNPDNQLQSTFVPGDAEPGNHLRVIVSYDDDEGNRRSIISHRTENTVENVNDVPTGPAIVPDAPVVGDLLTAVDLVDDDGIESVVEDGIIEYVWEQNAGGGWTEFANSGVEPYVLLVGAQQGSRIRVTANFTDDHGMAESAESEPTQPVGEGVPNNPATGQPQIDGQAMVAETLVVTTGDVEDLDGILQVDGGPALQYQWQLSNGTEWEDVVGAVGESYTPAQSAEGRRVRVVVSFTDERGFNEVVFSQPTAELAAAGGDAPSSVSGSNPAISTGTSTGVTPPTDQRDSNVGLFSDSMASTFAAEIETVAAAGIAGGFADGTFRPQLDITRGQMATLLANGLGLDSSVNVVSLTAGVAQLSDITGNVHRRGIEALASAGIIQGYADGTFRPSEPITRGQMATYLAQGLGLPAGGAHGFEDAEGTTHESSIAAVRAAGITAGTSPTTYDPDGFVTRGQMAAFLVRAFGLDAEG